jgi:hypothetical protein
MSTLTLESASHAGHIASPVPSQTPQMMTALNTKPAQPHTSKPKLIVRLDESSPPLDITNRVIGIIAEQLWKLHQGNDVLNWLEAERLFVDAMERSGTHHNQPFPNPRRTTAKFARHGHH